MGNGPDTLLRHVTRSQAATVASLYDPKPNAVLSFYAVLCQVSVGFSQLLLPSWVHINAVLGCLVGSILRTYPIELPVSLEDLLTDGTDVSLLSNLLI